MSVTTAQEHDVRRARALAAGLRDVATDLRLIDAIDLIGFVHRQDHPAIDDLVASSAELFFQPGALRYAMASRVNIGWTQTPSVQLDLEFQYETVTVFLCLTLEGRRPAVHIYHMLFTPSGGSRAHDTQALFHALSLARHV